MTGLKVSNLAVSLGGRLTVDGVSFGLDRGALLGVVGPNGAGKSTLLKALAAVTPYTGSVQWDEQELNAIPATVLARRRAYLPQGGNVHWPLAARAVVALGRFPFGDAATTAGQAAVAAAMQSAGVTHLAERPIQELSGGERARVLLARGLASDASLIIADEPAAQLDPRHAWQALSVLRAAADNGAMVIVALHDLTAAARLCDRVLMMDEGRVRAFGPPTEVVTQERLSAVFGIDAHIGHRDGAPYVVPLQAARA